MTVVRKLICGGNRVLYKKAFKKYLDTAVELKPLNRNKELPEIAVLKS